MTTHPSVMPAAYQVARYDVARWVLSAPQLSKDPSLAWEALGYPAPPVAGSVGGGAAAGAGGWIRNLTNTDPPDHTRLRRLLAGALTPARMAAMGPGIGAAARALGASIASLAGAPEVDLVASFTGPLQIRVMGDLLGIPPSQRATFGFLASEMVCGSGRPGARDEAYRRMSALIGELLEARRACLRPEALPALQPDLLGALIAVRHGTDRLSPAETRSAAMAVITAGHEPTADLIASGVLALLAHPGQLDRFRRDPAVRPRAIEELLRLEAPVRCAVRIAPDATQIGDAPAPHAGLIEVRLDQAHRDPSHFADPETLDISRLPNPHLSFGHGIHYCLGAPLARLQARLAITEVVNRFPGLALAESSDRMCWWASPGRHGLVRLPVRLGPAISLGVAPP